MTIRNLEKFFEPGSVALFGASTRTGSIGNTVADNLYKADFRGPVWLVNPKYKSIDGHPCYKNLKQLPGVPDLAIIATPPGTVPGLISDLSAAGTGAAIVITAGLRENDLTKKMLEASRPNCLRIIGPNCLGMISPGAGLNASFAHTMPQDGDLAFLSQSGAVVSAVLDWAKGEGIGFSSMISMGDMADVDLGDLLDYLAADARTRAILMYLEQVTDARKFMSAARSAARVKPVVVIKSGRHAEAAKAAHSHTGALAGSEAAYNAAFHRAGILRVLDLEDLFAAAEAISRLKPTEGNRLAIVTNGGGAGVLAVDRLIDLGGNLAPLSDRTIAQLDKVLPPTWSGANPVDIIGDAGPERYQAAMEAVLDDPGIDAILVMNCPTALASSTETAKATIATIDRHNQEAKHPKSILTAWLGDGAAQEARRLFSASGYPTYVTPADAVRGFTYLTRHARDQKALMRTPPSVPEEFNTEPDLARKIIRTAIQERRDTLTEFEAKSVLGAYKIPVVDTVTAATPEEVGAAASKMLGGESPEVVVKILSKDISHKSDVGGVVLGITTVEGAREAAGEMLVRARKVRPDAAVEGFTIQQMVRRPNAHELIIGVSEDRTFGPLILFGAGGTAVEVIRDTSTALPPLDMKLAHDLMDETRIYRLLKGYRNRPGADLDAIALTLVKVSQMVAELPEIVELDINPLLADENGVIALDARIIVRDCAVGAGRLNPRFAIRPYPKHWEKTETLASGKKILIRPIKPEDEIYYDLFMEKTSRDDIRLRLFLPLRKLSHEFIARLTQIDYARAMAFIAIDPETDEMLGVSRISCDPDKIRAEYGVITRTDVKGQGIGWLLMQQLMLYAESEGIKELWGQVLRENTGMLNMCRELGFQVETSADDATVMVVTLPLPFNKPV